MIAVQETKCEIEQLKAEQLNYYGYSSVFRKCQESQGLQRCGCIYKPGIKYKVLHATLNKKDFYDEEGRTIVLQFDNFYFINCYWPNGGKE